MKPYTEYGCLRIFSPGVEDGELEWHVDFENRVVEILEPGGWYFQFDNEVPRPLVKGEKIFIEKFNWHRIIKGEKSLVVRITKLS